MTIARNKGISRLDWPSAINFSIADRRSLRLRLLMPRLEMTKNIRVIRVHSDYSGRYKTFSGSLSTTQVEEGSERKRGILILFSNFKSNDFRWERCSI